MKDYFYVSRRKWARGGANTPYGSYLYLKDTRKMCCLGFFCNQMGIPKKDMNDLGDPAEIINAKKEWEDIPYLVVQDTYTERAENSSLANNAIQLNDLPNISEKEREERLKGLFAQHGIELEFFD